jgi:hypothetical protein
LIYNSRVKEVRVIPAQEEIPDNTPPAQVAAQVAETLITIVDEAGTILGVMPGPVAPTVTGKGFLVWLNFQNIILIFSKII